MMFMIVNCLIEFRSLCILDDINSLAVTSDSRFLVTCGIDSIKVFELDTFQEVYHLENAHEGN